MSQFLLLSGEALRDAGRRRIVFVVVLVSLFSILFVDSCTSCATGEVQVNGQSQSLAQFAGYTGAATFVVLGLWCVVLAGVLAAEHLAQTLGDGSANLTLARPVGRATFALSRLAGALAIAGLTAAALLGATAFLLQARGGLPIAPAVLAAAGVALGGITVGALAMAASLALPRVACVLLAFLMVAGFSTANLVALVRGAAGGTEGTGALSVVDLVGPPLLSSIVLALDPWFEEIAIQADPLAVWTKLGLWSVGAVALLVAAFRRLELGR